ncbi:carboxymuconolactone decarboxylase family protein [Halioxenophilus sp. WMMB6]|uniref:carboxymuconolactone decarboxylase family protein n=1 Tax=Halioxenophilus sp. WMMB6 TaxID=3073815 RepID=UPI00295F3347|nr:carboxymuconolactone decarboxylase family protein [Halioxenophilus sp. WMMB6]
MTNDPTPRLPPLPVVGRSERAQQVVEVFSSRSQYNVDANPVLNTLAHHPDLAEPFLIFNRYLLKDGELPVRLRQIAIMRVAWLKKSPYVWSSHLRTSLRNGLSGDDFEPIKIGSTSDYWNNEEQTVLQATEYLLEQTNLSDELWTELSQFLNEQQLVEFLFVVGTYILVSIVNNSLAIGREDELLELAEKYGSP